MPFLDNIGTPPPYLDSYGAPAKYDTPRPPAIHSFSASSLRTQPPREILPSDVLQYNSGARVPNKESGESFNQEDTISNMLYGTSFHDEDTEQSNLRGPQ